MVCLIPYIVRNKLLISFYMCSYRYHILINYTSNFVMPYLIDSYMFNQTFWNLKLIAQKFCIIQCYDIIWSLLNQKYVELHRQSIWCTDLFKHLEM